MDGLVTVLLFCMVFCSPYTTKISRDVLLQTGLSSAGFFSPLFTQPDRFLEILVKRLLSKSFCLNIFSQNSHSSLYVCQSKEGCTTHFRFLFAQKKGKVMFYCPCISKIFATLCGFITQKLNANKKTKFVTVMHKK